MDEGSSLRAANGPGPSSDEDHSVLYDANRISRNARGKLMYQSLTENAVGPGGAQILRSRDHHVWRGLGHPEVGRAAMGDPKTTERA